MAHTLESVKAQLQADITASNTKTGASDTNIHAAMSRLIAGFGSGSGGITPTGTKQISSNGTHDVANYAYAEVNVPASGITPTGTKSITSNGTHDVTNYASANVNVPSITEIIDINITATKGGSAATTVTLASGNAFAKTHYAKEGFMITLVPQFQVPFSTGAIVTFYHGNRKVSGHSTAWTGVGLYWSSSTTVAAYQIATALSGTTYQAGFRVNSSGNIVLYLPANRYLVAGQYKIVMTVAG